MNIQNKPARRGEAERVAIAKIARSALLVAAGALALWTTAKSSALATEPQAAPSTPSAATQPAIAPGVAEDPGPWYRIDRFELKYASPRPDHVPIFELAQTEIRLTKTANGYVPPGADVTEFKLIEAPKDRYSLRAIYSICSQLVRALNERGMIGIEVSTDQIEPNGDDRRQGQTALQLTISTGEVVQVRTLAAGERINPQLRENNPAHQWIRDHSPVQPRTEGGAVRGSLLRQDLLEEYLFALSRHPGRRVDMALSQGDVPGGAVLDYIVTENDPWLWYTQVSNTGTSQTKSVRERFGLIQNQLTGRDDTLTLDYITAGFQDTNALLGSYEWPLDDDRTWRARGFASWSQYTASDVGFAGEDFEGESWSIGGEVSTNIFQYREFFIDAIAGLRFDNIKVDNQAVAIVGEAGLLIPNIGARFERTTQIDNTMGAVFLEFCSAGWTGVDEAELTELGRFLPSEDWVVLRWDATHSFFLEPLLDPDWEDPEAEGSKLAHEIQAVFKGQYAFDRRLIPQFEQVVGGLYTVRGYPESVVAGDSTVIGNLEYRFHVPRAFYQRPDGRETVPEPQLFGGPFRWVPQTPYGTADWDVVLKAFFDAGWAGISEPFFFESDHTLLSAGVGIDFLFKRNLTVRVDWGFVLRALEDLDVNSGSNRVQFVATFLF
ncbi:MAG: hypothetical protein L0Y42_03045 [Phycisphaerales bacterium]|nr:hypothetical protein [Phycisphaerales bacterium]